MELLGILRTLRRHWILILALTVVGGALGAASTKLDGETTRRSRTYHKASTTLVVDLASGSERASGQSAFQSLEQVAIFTTTGDVPNEVAKKLGSDESGRELAEHITTTTDGNTSTITITAAEPSDDGAVELADGFATQLVTNLDQRGQDAYSQTRDKLQSRLDNLNAQENALLGQIAANPPNVDNLKAQLAALNNQYRITYDSYASLAALGPPTSRFTTLQKAEAVPIDEAEYQSRLNLGATSRNNLSTNDDSDATGNIVTVSSSTPLESPLSRGVVGALLGLMAGIGLAFMLERLDHRIRTRADAEAAFALPVVAEVPQVTKSQQRDRDIVSTEAPLSRFAEAHRAIRSSLLFTRAAMATEPGGTTSAPATNGASLGDTLFEPEHGEPLVVMVTSPSPGEGKTSTTANLAAVFAEAGSAVLVVNCDFRRPAIHRFFGVDDEPRRVLETSIPGVKVVTNVLADPGSNPAQVVAAQRQVVAAARGRFDVILLDTAPLLTANDAVELVTSADLVLLVARVGSTSSVAAHRTMDLLNRLDVPLSGVVLVGATAASNDYYYYYQPGRVSEQPTARHRTEASRPRMVNGNGSSHGSDADLFVGEPTTSD